MGHQINFMEYQEAILDSGMPSLYGMSRSFDAIQRGFLWNTKTVCGIQGGYSGIPRSFHVIPRSLNGIPRTFYGIPKSFIEYHRALSNIMKLDRVPMGNAILLKIKQDDAIPRSISEYHEASGNTKKSF